MVYVSSRVSADILGEQLRSLPPSLPGLTKLELRYIVPSSVPCLGTSLQQLQQSLTALTGLGTLYLIMGTSPEPAEVTAVLPALPALRDLKLLSGLPQYGFTNAKLAALGCTTQLQRLHLEVSGVGQVDAGLAALSRLSRLQQLLLDGLVTLGPAVVSALQQLPKLKELKLELDSSQYIPDLFALSALTALSLTYHGDELDEADDPPNGDGAPGPGGGSGADWEALDRLVRGNAARPVVIELGLTCCSFPADPLPRIALLTSLRSLNFYDCRWTAAAGSGSSLQDSLHAPAPSRTEGLQAATTAASLAPACLHPNRPGSSWSLLTSLGSLQALGMAQCVVPPVNQHDLAALAVAWTGMTSLQLQSALHPGSPAQPPPARFAAYLSRWCNLEALTLSGSWCNDPRVALDVSLLPPSLTSLVISSVTLLWSAAAKTAIIDALEQDRAIGAEGVAASDPPGFASIGGVIDLDSSSSNVGTFEGTSEAQSERVEEGPGGPISNPTMPCSSLSLEGDNSSQAAATTGTCRALSGSSCCCATCGDSSSCSHGTNPCKDAGQTRANRSHSSPAGSDTLVCAPDPPVLTALEHLVLGEVRLGPGLSLQLLASWAPNLRSLEINNLLPNLTDESCTALAALTALTVLRVSQDQDPDQVPHWQGPEAMVQALEPGVTGGEGRGSHCGGVLSGMGLTALTGLRSLRQLEWLPWGCEALGLEHVEALSRLRKLHLVTLRGARDGAIGEAALEALRERLPLCDIDDTEWSGLVDV